jgi:glutamine synthetase
MWGKSINKFTKKEIISYVLKNKIRIINFRYPAWDGRLKTLSFPVTGREYLDTILTFGERADGSSLFPFIEAGASDLYLVPRLSTVCQDPFSEIPALSILCSYLDGNGKPLDCSPEYTLSKAASQFERLTGCTFEAMGELEFYISAPATEMFKGEDQKGYHESTPFAKFEDFRNRAMTIITDAGGKIKYSHCEVGNFTLNGRYYEQNEIEFLPSPVRDAADQLVMAKWILRTLAAKEGLDLTFAPKITKGKAGSGLHFHTRIMKNGKPVMIDKGELSETARKMIGGYIKCASSLTAFGNINPTSYFRLVPHQEAPTEVCWGMRNRSVLIRVPLGWRSSGTDRQTVEIRSSDGSADIYLILAGITVAATIGLTSPDSLNVTSESFVDINIHDNDHSVKRAMLQKLPASCYESANELERNRELYEKSPDGGEGAFSPELINGAIARLRSYCDSDLRRKTEEDQSLMEELVMKNYHCG